ncbi:MAG: alpha/beta fold hydrolase [Chloroflexi bacterium]|nr:alpha/beta fold hydrolase [Chloroflexota bacterium]
MGILPTKRLLLYGVGLSAALGATYLYGRRLTRLNETHELDEIRDGSSLIDVDGVRVHYVESGKGPAVVLLHGMGASTFSFRRTIPALAESRCAVALDLPGFGLSDRARLKDASLTGAVRLVKQVIERLGIERAAVIGHSMGGAIALRFAEAYPNTVERLVLVSSALPNGIIPRWVRPFWRGPLVRTMVSFALHNEPFREYLWRSGVADVSTLSDEVRRGLRRPIVVRGTTEAITSVGIALFRDRPVDLSRVHQPVLLLWGEGDRWLDLRSARALLWGLPDARLQIIPHARHMVLEERPEEANAAILSFLREREAAAAPEAARTAVLEV